MTDRGADVRKASMTCGFADGAPGWQAPDFRCERRAASTLQDKLRNPVRSADMVGKSCASQLKDCAWETKIFKKLFKKLFKKVVQKVVIPLS